MAQRGESKPIAYSAAAIYGGAATIGIVEGAIPGGPPFSLAPSVAALVFCLLTFADRPAARPAARSRRSARSARR